MVEKSNKSDFNLYDETARNITTTQKMSRECSKNWMMLKIRLDAKKVEDVMWKAIELLKKELHKVQEGVSYESKQP